MTSWTRRSCTWQNCVALAELFIAVQASCGVESLLDRSAKRVLGDSRPQRGSERATAGKWDTSELGERPSVDSFLELSASTEWQLPETMVRIDRATQAASSFLSKFVPFVLKSLDLIIFRDGCTSEAMMGAYEAAVTEMGSDLETSLRQLPGPPWVDQARPSRTDAPADQTVARRIGSPAQELSYFREVLEQAALALPWDRLDSLGGAGCEIFIELLLLQYNAVYRAYRSRILSIYWSHLLSEAPHGLAAGLPSLRGTSRAGVIMYSQLGFYRFHVLPELLRSLLHCTETESRTSLNARTNSQMPRSLLHSSDIPQQVQLSVAEIGVNRAGTTSRLLREFPNLEIIGVDPYVSYADTVRKHNTVGSEDDFSEAVEVMKPFLGRWALLTMASSMAAAYIANASLDMVFVDGEHSYESCLQDIVLWAPKVKRGGIVAGHDYHGAWPGVVRAVHETLPAEAQLYVASDWVWWWWVPDSPV